MYKYYISDLDGFTKIIKIIVFIILVIISINSNGYHHPDEHFQIIEFAGLKAGWNIEEYLTWEYDYKIRPTLQVYIALLIIKTALFFHVKNPFFIALILRLLTALFSIIAISFFVKSSKHKINKNYYYIFILLSFFLWFLPSINVRFSSETWSGLCLLISTALIQMDKKNKLNYFLIGIFWGLSFEFRFQIALAIVGFLAWLVVINKNKLRDFFYIIAGGLVVVGFCTLLDSLFYGQFVFTPFNYFKTNLIDNPKDLFGTQPWFFYIISILNGPTLIIGASIIISLLITIIFDVKNLILWGIIPFIVIHSIIPHKEVRFLFPLVNFIPIILMNGFQLITEKKINNEYYLSILKSVILAMVIINFGGLVMMMFKPAGNGSINIIQHINKEYDKNELLNVYVFENNNPFIIGNAKGLKTNFYIPENLQLNYINDVFLQNVGNDKKIVIPKNYYSEREILENNNYKIEKSGIPNWVMKMNILYRIFNDSSVPLLYTDK